MVVVKELTVKMSTVSEPLEVCVKASTAYPDKLGDSCKGELNGLSLSWSPGSAMVVVMASQGYPGTYEKGTVIRNLEEAELVAPSVSIFHAGTTLDSDGNFIAVGGRVLGVTAKGKDIEEARDRAYRAVEEINWPEGFFRRDIGWRALHQRQFSTKG